MHNTITIDTATNPKQNITLNFDADLLVMQNLTADSILVRIGGLDYPIDVNSADIYIPPFSSLTHSIDGIRQFAFVYSTPAVSPIPAGSPTTSIITMSQNEPVPTFSGMPITNVNAAISGTVTTNTNINPGQNVGVTGNIPIHGQFNTIWQGSIAAHFNQVITVDATAYPNATMLCIMSSAITDNYNVIIKDQSGVILFTELIKNQPQTRYFPLPNSPDVSQFVITFFSIVGAYYKFSVVNGGLPTSIDTPDSLFRTVPAYTDIQGLMFDGNIATGDGGTVRASATPDPNKIMIVTNVSAMIAATTVANSTALIVRAVNTSGVMLWSLLRTINQASVPTLIAFGCEARISGAHTLQIYTINGSGATLYYHCSAMYYQVPQV